MNDPLSIAQGIVWIHALVTVYLAGLVWFVQIVHYPLMARVGDDDFPRYERAHSERTSLVVAPPMLIELACAIWLAAAPPPGVGRPGALAGLALVAVLWASTFFIQVPCHRRLERGFDAAAHRRLVQTNWVRTAAWSLRAVLAVGMVAAAAHGDA